MCSYIISKKDVVEVVFYNENLIALATKVRKLKGKANDLHFTKKGRQADWKAYEEASSSFWNEVSKIYGDDLVRDCLGLSWTGISRFSLRLPINYIKGL